ncbi:MAG: hypothetical protein JWN11_947 [Hyphomicrobiales bacterium]|jgi:hypothetical protein|nr:hypothetical protein [Hyphomicrobiales bacterium]
MPTLIRLTIALLFLAGLAFAGLFALTIFVDPGEKEITVKIPARQLVANPQAETPSQADTPVVQAPAAPANATASDGQPAPAIAPE